MYGILHVIHTNKEYHMQKILPYIFGLKISYIRRNQPRRTAASQLKLSI